MVVSTARQSVIIKCNMQASVLLSNYEFYYAAGLFCKLSGSEVSTGLPPQELAERLAPKLKEFAATEEREAYLVELLSRYKALEEHDAQMDELFAWGLSEENIWQMNGK